MESIKTKLRDWTVKHAKGPHAKLWLSAVSFSESSFFPVPPDIILIAILLTAERARWFFYSLLTTITSVLGGLLGYLIGAVFFGLFGESIVAFYGLEEELVYVTEQFGRHAFLTIFIAAFTPIPYKVFTITAGLLHIPLLVFIAASLLGRGARFFFVGYALHRYGKRVSDILYSYFNAMSFLILAFLVLFFYFIL